jgi:hypothetical protein
VNGRLAGQAGVGPVPVVAVQPLRQGIAALDRGPVRTRVSPLPQTERVLLRRLAILSGPFTLEAAALAVVLPSILTISALSHSSAIARLNAPHAVFCLTCSQTLEITTEPSPTAEATRFTDPARTSPTAKMPG